jgi:hypothetical protein
MEKNKNKYLSTGCSEIVGARFLLLKLSPLNHQLTLGGLFLFFYFHSVESSLFVFERGVNRRIYFFRFNIGIKIKIKFHLRTYGTSLFDIIVLFRFVVIHLTFVKKTPLFQIVKTLPGPGRPSGAPPTRPRPHPRAPPPPALPWGGGTVFRLPHPRPPPRSFSLRIWRLICRKLVSAFIPTFLRDIVTR